MRITCPACGNQSEAPDDYRARRGRCPFCKATFPLPPSQTTPPPPPLGPPKRRKLIDDDVADPLIRQIKSLLRKLIFPRWRLVLAVAVVGWLFTMNDPRPWRSLAHYASAVAIGAAVWHAVAGRWLKRGLWQSGLAAGILCAWTWSYFDFTVEQWTDSHNGNTEHFIDYYRRGADSPYYRMLWIKSPEGGYLYNAEGGFSASFKKHGEWITSYNDFLNRTHTWYWYGDEITEGEWHLRSDR